MTAAVPTNVQPGEYWIEAKWEGGIPIAWGQTLVVLEPKVVVEAGAQPRHDRDKIVFADLNWDSAQMQNAIAKFIIQTGYGYPTDGIYGGAVPMFESLTRGNVHVMIEVWLPNYQEVWDESLIEGSIIPLGRSLDDNWQSGFVVPSYVIEGDPERGIEPMAPDLNTVMDLHKYRQVFATPASRGKAVLVDCLASWACAEINHKKAIAYGLDGMIKFKDPGSADLLFASLYDAYEKGEPWLGYLWGPTDIVSKLDLTLLEEPPYTKLCWVADKGCAYASADVMTAVHPSLIARAPEVVEFLRLWHIDAASQIAAEDHMASTGGSFEETALWFLQTQEAVWTQWVPSEVADRVREALENR